MKYQKGLLSYLGFNKIKGKILIWFCLIFSFQIIYCQDVKDLADLGLNGKIKKVIIKEHLAAINLGEIEATEILTKYIYQFYENGKIKSRNFKIDNIDNAEISQNYNEKGYLTSTHFSRQYFTHMLIDSIVYNSSNVVDRRIISVGDVKNFKGTIYLERTFYYNYNNNGDLISIKNSYSGHGAGGDPVIFPCLNCKEITLLNLNIIQSYVSQQSTKVHDIWNESYNEPKITRERNVQNQYEQNIDIQYFYDDRKNWIKSIVFYGHAASPYMIKTREITYY